jgi:hypothetical protein
VTLVQPRLVRIEGSFESFAPLFKAASEKGFRFGWLALGSVVDGPPELERATSAGAFRAVAAGADRTLALKRLKGKPVLRDLVRKHFTGCRLLLVRGPIEAPRLERRGEKWRLVRVGGDEENLSTERFLRALRKPDFP